MDIDRLATYEPEVVRDKRENDGSFCFGYWAAEPVERKRGVHSRRFTDHSAPTVDAHSASLQCDVACADHRSATWANTQEIWVRGVDAPSRREHAPLRASSREIRIVSTVLSSRETGIVSTDLHHLLVKDDTCCVIIADSLFW